MVNTKCADGAFFCKDSCIGCLPYSLGGYMTFFHASQIKGIQGSRTENFQSQFAVDLFFGQERKCIGIS